MTTQYSDMRIKRVEVLGVDGMMLRRGRDQLIGHFGEEQGNDFFLRILNVLEGTNRMMSTTLRRSLPILGVAEDEGTVSGAFVDNVRTTMHEAITATGKLANYIFTEMEREGLTMTPDQFDRELRVNLEKLVRQNTEIAESIGQPSP